MSLVKNVREFIKQCPYLKDYEGAIRIGVDYLGEYATTYSIESVPCQPIVKKYIDGSSVRQELFIFCSREAWGEDVFQNLENCEFYENFYNWLEEMNRNKRFPYIGNKRYVRKIELLSNGYAFAVDVDKAQYQIQFKITYFQEV